MRRRLVITLLCLTAGLFVVDRLGGMVMRQVALHTQDVLGPKLRDMEEGIDADVVLMGASRCHHHYVPSILADTLGMSVYNAGVGGSNNIFAHYVVLCHILHHHTPRVVCLELMTTDYVPQEAPFHPLAFFAPLFGSCAEADSVYRLAGTYWRYQASHLYRYNAKAASNIIGLAMNRQAKADRGYMPLPEPASHPREPELEESVMGCDSLKVEYLHRFIRCCRQRNISLVFMVSPKFTVAPVGHYQLLKDVARENGVPFLDYHSKRLYHDHPEYFRDATHLWDEGARIYTTRFAGELRRVITRNADFSAPQKRTFSSVEKNKFLCRGKNAAPHSRKRYSVLP